MNKFLFYREDDGIKSTEEYDVHLNDRLDIFQIETAIEEYAEHYYNNRDGEISWPVFCITELDGEFIGRSRVNLETRPIFYAKIQR